VRTSCSRSGSDFVEAALHDGDVVPAAELESGFALDADQAEAVALVEAPGRDVLGRDPREQRVVPEHPGPLDQVGEDQAPEARTALASPDVDGILDRSGEGALALVGREGAIRHHVPGGDRDDGGVALGVPGQPLTQGVPVPGLGVGGRLGAEDLVVPDLGDLREVRLARVADLDGPTVPVAGARRA
jgi:hypothetical protein